MSANSVPHQLPWAWCVQAMPRAPTLAAIPHSWHTHACSAMQQMLSSGLPCACLCCVQHWAWRERCYPFWVSVSERALTAPMPCWLGLLCRNVELTAGDGDEGGRRVGLHGGSLGSRVQEGKGGRELFVVVLFGFSCGTRSHHAVAAVCLVALSHAAAQDLLCQATSQGPPNELMGTQGLCSLLHASAASLHPEARRQRCGVSAGVPHSFGHTAGDAPASQGTPPAWWL